MTSREVFVVFRLCRQVSCGDNHYQVDYNGERRTSISIKLKSVYLLYNFLEQIAVKKNVQNIDLFSN